VAASRKRTSSIDGLRPPSAKKGVRQGEGITDTYQNGSLAIFASSLAERKKRGGEKKANPGGLSQATIAVRPARDADIADEEGQGRKFARKERFAAQPPGRKKGTAGSSSTKKKKRTGSGKVKRGRLLR